MRAPPHAKHFPLSALLSQALVAFTIELDNEFEQRMPHRTTRQGGESGPWLASLAMWFNCMRFVGSDPITVAELRRRARTHTNVNGMERWGYLQVRREAGTGPSRWLLSATRTGERARRVWEPLVPEVEQRWQVRFGAAASRLRACLQTIAAAAGAALPDCMPILGFGLLTQPPDAEVPATHGNNDEAAGLPLPALLARSLVLTAAAYEARTQRSLAASANVLRLADSDTLTPLRTMPQRSGVSREAVHISLTQCLVRRGLLEVTAMPAPGRGRALRLTAAGAAAQAEHLAVLEDIEREWDRAFGAAPTGDLRSALESIVLPEGPGSPLLQGLKPYPGSWRAAAPPIAGLPHFPMVLHRGGYPDGA